MLQKRIILLLFCINFIGCTSSDKNRDVNALKNYKVWNVKLLNSLGVLTIYLPAEIDSAFQFTHREDYKGGDYKVFRFSSKKYTIDNDSNWLQNKKKIDSLYQVSIEQNVYESKIKDTINLPEVLKGMKSYFREMDPYAFISSDGNIQTINNKQFAVCWTYLKGYFKDTTNHYCTLVATTFLKNNYVSFNFECLSKDTTGFIGKMMTSLKTVQIDTITKL